VRDLNWKSTPCAELKLWPFLIDREQEGGCGGPAHVEKKDDVQSRLKWFSYVEGPLDGLILSII